MRKSRSTLKEDLKPHYPDTYTGTADLYVYFYERALQFLRPGGVISYITSNKWYRAAYGEKLRAHLGKTTTLLHAIDFGDAPVFTAIAYPTIVIARKAMPGARHTFRALNWDPETPNTEIANFAKFYESKASRLAQGSLSASGWRFLAKKGQDLLDVVRAAGKPLGEYVRGRFFYGIKTGLNDAFVVDRETRDRLIAEDKSSKELLRPFLRGRDVKRWRCDSQDLWLIFVPWHCPLQDDPSIEGCSEKAEKMFAQKYPAVFRHLSGFKAKLAARNQAETGVRYEWYALQRWAASYHKEFDVAKVVYPDIFEHRSFAFEPNAFVLTNTSYFIPHETRARFFTAVLNAPVFEWFYGQISNRIRGGYLRAFSDYMEQVPIPQASTPVITLIEQFVDVLGFLHDTKSATQTAGHPRDPLMREYYEELVNALVYELYLPADLHAAGLHFFDLIAAAKLPDLAAKPKVDDKEKLRLLRDKFAELYAPSHALRAALQKLHTLDPIRIIEGKA